MLSKSALENLFHGLIAELTGLPPELARPRWQPGGGPALPEDAVTWAAFGITQAASVNFPAWVQTGPDTGKLTLCRDLTLLVSFYGPEAEALASGLEAALHLDWNRRGLRENGISLVCSEGMTLMPEPSPAGWLNRADLSLRFGLLDSREYAASSLLDMDGELLTDKQNGALPRPPLGPLAPDPL